MKYLLAIVTLLTLSGLNSANAAFVSAGKVVVNTGTTGVNTFNYAVDFDGASTYTYYYQLGSNPPIDGRTVGGLTQAFAANTKTWDTIGGTAGLILSPESPAANTTLTAGPTNNKPFIVGTDASSVFLTATGTQTFGSISRYTPIFWFTSDRAPTLGSGSITYAYQGVVQGVTQVSGIAVPVPVPAGVALALIGLPFAGLIRRKLARV